MLKVVLSFFLVGSVYATCPTYTHTIVLGDSQTGATWSKTYFGNYLQQCLNGDFKIYGQGGSVVRTWMNGGLENIDIVERSPTIAQKNIGKRKYAPNCKKRVKHILDEHLPTRVMYFFGDNYIASSSNEITREVDKLITLTKSKNINECYFLTPTYEMQVGTRRNVSRKNLTNDKRIRDAIVKGVNGRCTVIDGLKLMKDSKYFDGKSKLKRVPIKGHGGCTGAARNDNIHYCGEAARDFAQRVCQILN
jgi:hypothetical protein